MSLGRALGVDSDGSVLTPSRDVVIAEILECLGTGIRECKFPPIDEYFDRFCRLAVGFDENDIVGSDYWRQYDLIWSVEDRSHNRFMSVYFIDEFPANIKFTIANFCFSLYWRQFLVILAT